MEILKKLIIPLSFIFSVFQLNAQYRVVTDPYTTAVVLENTAAQMAIERQHNQRLDSIRSQQDKIEMYTTSMAAIAEMYKLTMENIKGFGPESRYYIEIGRCAVDIVKDFPELLKVVKDAKWHNKILCANELGNLFTKTQTLVSDFVNIVNNGKVANPLKDNAAEKRENDGYNFLDRYQRLALANMIYTDLLEIKYKVQIMKAMAQYSTKHDLFFAIDPLGWANVMSMQNYVGGLINDWNNGLPDKWHSATIDKDKLDPIFKDILEWK